MNPSNLTVLHYENSHCTADLPFYILGGCGDMYVNVHNDIEILYVKKGCFRLYTDDMVWELYKNEAFIINAGSVHFGFSEPDTEYEVLLTDWNWLNPGENPDADIDRFRRFVRGELRHTHHIIRHGDRCGLHEMVLHIWQLFDRRQPGWKLQVIAGLYTLAAQMEISGCLTETESGFQSNPNVLKNDIVLLRSFFRYVHLHFSEPLSVAAIAGLLHVSESRLYKVCKKINRCAPTQYITQYRLMRAAQMLTATANSVTEICYDCGFENVSYFITRFRARYGVTPHRFRSQNTEK